MHLKYFCLQKSPTKILPAPQVNATNKISQRLIIKPTTTSQLIQVPQSIGSTQLHQINIPGKGVRFFAKSNWPLLLISLMCRCSI